MLRHKSLHPLSHQHHNGLALSVIVERALNSDASPETIARLGAKCVDRFDLELVNHFQLEETLLFPAILREIGPVPLVEELIAEHRRMERQIADLRVCPGASVLSEFAALLRTHIRREENELFEDVQGRLSQETMDLLGAELSARAVQICLEP